MDYKFKCPKCGSSVLALQHVDAIITTPVSRIRTRRDGAVSVDCRQPTLAQDYAYSMFVCGACLEHVADNEKTLLKTPGVTMKD
jgi:hypothetical protein